MLRSTDFSLKLVADNRFNDVSVLKSANFLSIHMRTKNFNIHVLFFLASFLVSAVVGGIIGLLERDFFTG